MPFTLPRDIHFKIANDVANGLNKVVIGDNLICMQMSRPKLDVKEEVNNKITNKIILL